MPTSRKALKAFALIFANEIVRTQKIEAELNAKGPQRTASDVRCAAIECLLAHRNAMREVKAKMGIRTSETTPGPTSLELILFELVEVEQGRRSLLLEPRHAKLGVNALNHLRIALKAEAAALVQVLYEGGSSLNKAAVAVAEQLNNSCFQTPGKKGKERYSAETVKDWRKEARKLNAPFFEIYGDVLKAMRTQWQHLHTARADAKTIMLDVFAGRLSALNYRV
jgi:hypothetical protein